MARKEYNVAYLDSDGNMKLAFTTPSSSLDRANKRLVSMKKKGGAVDIIWDDKTGQIKDRIKRSCFIVSREISNWEIGIGR
jgi:hypothetical protein